jgi:malic enzyme
VFGGIDLEDIVAPRCFEVEERLRQVIRAAHQGGVARRPRRPAHHAK